jgi:hypothetical protein
MFTANISNLFLILPPIHFIFIQFHKIHDNYSWIYNTSKRGRTHLLFKQIWQLSENCVNIRKFIKCENEKLTFESRWIFSRKFETCTYLIFLNHKFGAITLFEDKSK